MQDIDRYMRLMKWAAARYSQHGRLPLSRGNTLLAFTRLERAAARRYLGMR